MSIQINFNRMDRSEAIIDHVQKAMDELLKITDDKYPFNVTLTHENDNQYHITVQCNYKGKNLACKANNENLYRAISKGIEAMRTQIIRKSEKLRNE